MALRKERSILSVVPAKKLNTSLSKEMIHVKKQPKVTLICAGRPKPSKEAVRKFTELYIELIKNNEKREAETKYTNGKEV
jgi:hypothetical protein